MPVSAGSTPAEGTIAGEARQDEHPSCKGKAAGSSPATGSSGQRSTDGPCAALVRRRLSVRIRPLALGRRTGVQCCLANSACSVRYRGCPLRPDGQIGKGTWPRTRFLGVRLPVRVRMSAGCGSAWSEHSVRIRGVARSNRANPTQGAVDEVGRVARLSPGTRCGFEARPRHERWALGKLSRRRHARVAQLEERRSYTPEVGGSKPSAGTHERWWL